MEEVWGNPIEKENLISTNGRNKRIEMWIDVFILICIKEEMLRRLMMGYTCYYRPQTKFAKVMFSRVSVCPQGGLGLCPGYASYWNAFLFSLHWHLLKFEPLQLPTNSWTV